LLEIVGATHATGRLASRLNRREQQCYENADNGDYNQQLNERKT
jgi:hypothetical protein